MQTISKSQYSSKDLESLLQFLRDCQSIAKEKNRTQIASISLDVKYIDPLAVLQSIYEESESHFYLEHPASEEAVAGAEAIISKTFSGKNRFEQVREFAQDTLENTIVIGDLDSRFSGPHFFTAFSFFDEVTQGSPFPAATVFVPRWQVGRSQGSYTAVANILVEPNIALEQLVEKVWSAYQKFNDIDYDTYTPGDCCAEILHATTVGGKEYYPSAVEKALESIRTGKYEKIVLARALDLESDSPFNPLNSLNRLREQFPSCFPCSLSNGKGDSFIAAAPERLLKVIGGKLLTEAVAGSAPRGKNPQEDAHYGKGLLSSQKDLAEHQFVLDTIVSHLKDLGITIDQQFKTRLKQLANVQHLNTMIEAEMPKNVHFMDLVARLHPTPAVGGAPLNAALQGIKELENFERGLYAGALGYFDYRGDGEMVVGIRSAQINGNKARLYGGAGIVAGSEPEKEFQETEIKLQAMNNHLR